MIARKATGRSSTSYPAPQVSDIKSLKPRRRELEKGELEHSYPLLDRLNEGVLVCDFDGNFHFANSSAQDLLGYSANELIKMKFAEILAEGQMAKLIRTIEEIKLISHNTDIKRFSVISKSGSEIILAGKASLVVEGESPFGMLVFVRDVTDFFRMQEELASARVFRAVGQASSHAARDIRELISPARTLLSVIAKTDFRSMRESELLLVQSQCRVALETMEQVHKLTDEMIQLSVPGPKCVEPVKINRMMLDLLFRIKSSMAEKMAGITYKRNFSSSVPDVMGDRAQLERAISNILVNSVEAMPSGGILSVSTDLSESSVRIVISDTGHGMDQLVLDSIFVPYFTTKEGGSGLGLAISAKTVKDHGGQISVESELGSGTTFEIIIPASS